MPERLKDAGVTFARELLASRSGDPRLWTRLGELLNERDDQAGALAAIERALAVDEEFYPAHVIRVRTLFKNGKSAEAVAAVRQARLPLARHLAWAAELAREAADSGDDPAAAGLAEFVLEKEQHHFEALCVRAGVYERADDWQSYLRCAGILTRVYPKAAKSWGFYAHAQTATGDKSGAIASLRTALALEQAYEYAALALFDLLLESGDNQGARGPLDVLKVILSDDPRTLGRAFAWSLAAQDKDEAIQAFLKTAAIPNRGFESIEQAESLAKAGCHQSRPRRSLCASDAGGGHAEIVERAAAVFAAQDEWNAALKLLAQKADQGEPASAGLAFAVGTVANAASRVDKAGIVRQLVKAYSPLIKADDRAWALVGSAYEALGAYRKAVSWYGDWEARPNPVAPWAQFNIATCLRATGKHAKADAMNLACARSETRDHTYPAHAAYGALIAAAAGDLAEARAFVALATDDRLDGNDAYVKRLGPLHPGSCRSARRRSRFDVVEGLR